MKTLNYKLTKMMKSIVVSLILLVSVTGISKGATSINENSLAIQVKSWISNSSYWLEPDKRQTEELKILDVENDLNTVSEIESQELSRQIESWMNNSTYWTGEADRENREITRQIKSWMNSSTFWSNDAETSKPDLAFQIKSWINNGVYWNESADPVIGNNELASN